MCFRRFAEEAQVDGTYMFCRQDSVIQAAKFLSRVNPLSLQVRQPAFSTLTAQRLTCMACLPEAAYDWEPDAECSIGCVASRINKPHFIQSEAHAQRSSCGALKERFWFCMAPANLRSPVSAAALMRIAKMSAAPGTHGHDVPFEEVLM